MRETENYASLVGLRSEERKRIGLGSSPSDCGVQEWPAGLFCEDACSGKEVCGLS